MPPFNQSLVFKVTIPCNYGHFSSCLLMQWILSTSSTDFLSAWMCMTLSAHSIMLSPRGTLTRSCLRRPTRNSPGSSRLTVVDGRVRSMVASLRFWSHTIALLQTQSRISLRFCIRTNKASGEGGGGGGWYQCIYISFVLKLKTYRPGSSKCCAGEEELPGLKRD